MRKKPAIKIHHYLLGSLCGPEFRMRTPPSRWPRMCGRQASLLVCLGHSHSRGGFGVFGGEGSVVLLSQFD